MFFTQNNWEVTNGTLAQLAAPLRPWSRMALTTVAPKFLIELDTPPETSNFRFLLASGVEELLDIAATPGSRIIAAHVIAFGEREQGPRFEPLFEIRRTTQVTSPAIHSYRRHDGSWAALGFPASCAQTANGQVTVFSLEL